MAQFSLSSVLLGSSKDPCDPLIPGTSVGRVMSRGGLMVGARGRENWRDVRNFAWRCGTSMAEQHLRKMLAYLDVRTLGQPEFSVK
jgi:hypothetical protein